MGFVQQRPAGVEPPLDRRPVRRGSGVARAVELTETPVNNHADAAIEHGVVVFGDVHKLVDRAPGPVDRPELGRIIEPEVHDLPAAMQTDDLLALVVFVGARCEYGGEVAVGFKQGLERGLLE